MCGDSITASFLYVDRTPCRLLEIGVKNTPYTKAMTHSYTPSLIYEDITLTNTKNLLK